MLANGWIAFWFELSLTFCFAFSIWLGSGWLRLVGSLFLSKPESDSAIGQHLLESNQCARNYSNSQFKILTTARSQFHLSLLEAIYISRKKKICAGKSNSYSLYNCFGKIKACWHWIDCISPYYCAISLKSISPDCRVQFSLLHLVFERSCSPHTKPDRDCNWRVLSEKLIAKAKWNQLYWKSFSNSAPSQNCSLIFEISSFFISAHKR